ncbi:butyrate kinase, partial [Bacteroidota bacterium]
QVLKNIGSMYAVLKADVDAILLTGGLTNSEFFLNEIIEGLEKFPPVHIYSTDDIMEILAKNAFSLLNNETEIINY